MADFTGFVAKPTQIATTQRRASVMIDLPRNLPRLSRVSTRWPSARWQTRAAVARLVLTRDILGRFHGGKAITTDTVQWVVAIWVGFATKPVGHRIFHDIRGRQGAVECGLGSSRVHPPHRASCLYPLLYSLYCTREYVLSRSSGSKGVIFLSEGRAAERGFVLMWRQEWAVVNKAYNALYRAQGLYKAVAALMRVPAVPGDFDRLISSGRLIDVAFFFFFFF